MRSLLSILLGASLLLPARLALAAPPDEAVPAPPPPTADSPAGGEVEAEAPTAVPGEDGGGAYGESVNYDWDGSELPQPPSTGPRVDIEVQNALNPTYLQRVGGAEPAEICEAPCGVQIGDGSGQFVLDGPKRRGSKPFTLGDASSYELVARGGNPKLRTLGIAMFPIAGVIAIGLIIVPTRINMRMGSGIAVWATAGVIAAVGVGTGVTLLRFSRTQVKVLPGG